MTRVFTKIDGKTAIFNVDTNDAEEAIYAVRDEVGLKHRPPILALVSKESDNEAA